MLKFEPSKFKAPKLSFKDIWQEADKFRQNYWPSEELPINIHDIIDLDLDMEIRCVSRLREITGFDALLLGNLKGIIVDQEDYMNDRMENRMRFSFAHEVGHYILHSDVYRNLPYTDEDGWIELIQNLPEEEYFWVEQHAYEFAGRLLVPKDSLVNELKETIKLLQTLKKNTESSGFPLASELSQIELAKEYIASYICRKYGVSDQVIIRRLDKEGLWPPTL